MPDRRHSTTPSQAFTAMPANIGRSRRPRRAIAIAALLIGTGIVAGAIHTPAVWAVPGVALIAGMWIAGRPRRAQMRAAASAAIALSVAGAVLLSPAVLLAWPAARLVTLALRRGLRALRVPLTVAAAVTALALTAAALGLPLGIALLATIPLALTVRRHHPRVTV